MAEFFCSDCSYLQPVSDEHIGKASKCPKCGQRGTVRETQLPIVVVPTTKRKSLEPIIERSSGGSVQTKLGHGIVLNQNSTLVREWITISDPRFPACLDGKTGISVIFDKGSDYSPSKFMYKAWFGICAEEDLQAFEVRYLTFDVWGQHCRTLSMVRIQDIEAQTKNTFESEWNLLSENEACEYYASIAFVAQIRTVAGKVLCADVRPVLAEAKRFSEKFSEDDLMPPRPQK